MGDGALQHVKPGKARFEHIYDRPDPREYFRVLSALDYRTPHHGQRVFPSILAALRVELGCDDLTVLDVCCSYGINAALLNHYLRLSDLSRRYCSPGLAAYTSEHLAEADRDWFGCRLRARPVRVIGLDAAEPAVAYALRAGLLTDGFAENLEVADPTPPLAEALASVDLITITGGVGYISERTMGRLLACASPRRTPWVAAFALRMVDYAPIAEVLASHGLVTERFTGTFPQRRFADPAESEYVLGELRANGIDPTDREETGSYHAQLFVSRPAAVVAALPLDALLEHVAAAPGHERGAGIPIGEQVTGAQSPTLATSTP